MKRWHALHIGKSQWSAAPEQIEIPLEFVPGPDMRAYAIPGLLVLYGVGGIESSQEAYGIDALTGKTLWRFSDTDDELLFFSCHVEHHTRIVATTRRGVYLLTREGPQCILKGKLSPAATGRLSPSGALGYVLDEEQRLLIFDVATGKVKWSRRAPKGTRFGNPFPLGEEHVCLSTGGDVRCWHTEGKTSWRWPVKVTKGEGYVIERLVMPDLLLVRRNSSTGSHQISLQANDGEFIAELGDMWAYGADGVVSHPVALFEGKHETIALLCKDGTTTESQKIHKMFGGFRTLPEGHAGLWYDALAKMVVSTNAAGDVMWREAYPDAMRGLAATFFGPETAYFASGAGTLHIWDVGG